MTPFGNIWSLMLRQQLVISSINLFNVVYTLRFSGEQIILKPVIIIYVAFRIIREELLYSCYFIWM
jgi:hypothetical protein